VLVDIVPAPPEENFAMRGPVKSATYTIAFVTSTVIPKGFPNWPIPVPFAPRVFHPVVVIAPVPLEENLTMRSFATSAT